MEKTKEELELELKQSLAQLEASYLMYDNTIKEIELKAKTTKRSEKDTIKTIELMKEAQDDIRQQYVGYGGDPNVLNNIKKYKTEKRGSIGNILSKITKPKKNTSIHEKLEQDIIRPMPVEKEELTKFKPVPVVDEPIQRETSFEISSGQFDVIPLPSKGECYKDKMATIPVGYLTARDENMITSPNLYRDNLVIDLLLANKIQNKRIDPDFLLPGDRDAIILWLRATGYGPEFPVSAIDPDTGNEFESVVDLTNIKAREFTLKGDENGYFDFKLPVSKDDIKFKFLNNKEEKILGELNTFEDKMTKKTQLLSIIERLETFIENSEMDSSSKRKLTQANTIFEEWASTIDDEETLGYTNVVTNRLEMSIMSINGINDRNYICEYVSNMNVRDSLELRKYITNNQPGLNYNVEIERPESLGGGSVSIFLKLDNTIFLNVS